MSYIHKSEMRVSIGMPVYNGAAYIRRALDSLLAQTFAEFELIISDNASMDGTQKICEEYERADSRIRYIRQKKNIGPIRNFDFVLNQAEGEYFMWAAHDDLWERRFIELLIRELELKGELSVAQCQVAYELEGKAVRLPNFMQGLAFQDKGIERGELKVDINQRYGELFYGIYRRKCLRLYLESFQADPVDIVQPVLLTSLLSGGAGVIENILFVKQTTMRVFLWTYLTSKAKGTLENNNIESLLLVYKKNEALSLWQCVRSILAACKYHIYVCKVSLLIIKSTTIRSPIKVVLSGMQLYFLIKDLFWAIKTKAVWRI